MTLEYDAGTEWKLFDQLFGETLSYGISIPDWTAMRSARSLRKSSRSHVLLRATSSKGQLLVGPGDSEGQFDLSSLVVIIALATVSVSLFFVTAATVHIAELLPDSFFFASQLPLAYWLGLLATLSLFLIRNRVKDRARTLLEISALVLFSLYLFALPSFVYQDLSLIHI